MNKPKFRIDIVVRVVPYDTSLPVAEKAGSVEETMSSDGWRAFSRLASMTKAAKLVERATDEVFGQEAL